jgi:hypothetical protein
MADSDEPRLIGVCIGVNEGPDDGSEVLENAVADAESVASAIERTQPDGQCIIFRLFSNQANGGSNPTKQAIRKALSQASAQARPQDTVLVFFAGHGRLAAGEPALVAAPEGAEEVDDPERWLPVSEAAACFEDCAAGRRVMLLDTCQIPSHTDNDIEADGDPPATDHVRARGGISQEFAERLWAGSTGWIVITSCSPGQRSIENEGHGVFSSRVAAGLRGEADLDGDGVVGLAEFVQYLGKRVSEDVRSVSLLTQNPLVIWRGPAETALTRTDGLTERSRLPDKDRTSKAGAGFLGSWIKQVFGRWPYESVAGVGFVRYGFGLLFGALLGIEAVIFAGVTRTAGVVAAGVSIATFAFWLATLGLSVAACQRRWHAGGYLTGLGIAAWQVLVGLLLVSLARRAPSMGASTATLIVDLFAIAAVVVVLGVNGFQCILSLAELLSRDERVPVQTALAELRRNWFHAKVPNAIAMQSLHPGVYLLGALGGTAVLVWHVSGLLLAGQLSAQDAVLIVRDLLLLVLIWAQAAWYQAAYRFLSGQARPTV